MPNVQPKKRTTKDNWSEKQLTTLKELYPATDDENIAKTLKKTVRSVRSKAFKLRLKKSNWYWQKTQEDWLNKNYPVLSFDELIDAFNKKFGIIKTKWAYINKYRELKNKK